MDKLKILVVDDESRMRKLVHDFLARNNYEVIEAENGEEAVDIFFEQKNIELIILDVMMPKMDGWQVCKEIRQYSKVPIIMLTAKGEEIDRIIGLELGADDYVTKPFNPVELMARVKSQLRRYMMLGGGKINEKNICIGGIELDDTAKKVTVDGEPVSLTPTEYEESTSDVA